MEQIQTIDEPPSSSHKIERKVWSHIWTIKIPNKVKVFIWRIMSNTLPCGYNLWKKRVVLNPICSICHEELESAEHILLTCEWTRPIWFEVCGIRICKEQVTTFDRWYKMMLEKSGAGKYNLERLQTLISYTCWVVWKHRCNIVLGKKEMTIRQVIDSIRRAMQEFDSLYGWDLASEAVEKLRRHQEAKWVAPSPAWFKINTDGAHIPGTTKAGIGIVCRDSERNLVEGDCRSIRADCAEVAEAQAFKAGAQMAVDKKWAKVEMETDSEILHKALVQRKGKYSWKLAPLITDIQALLLKIPEKKIQLIRRNANKAAD